MSNEPFRERRRYFRLRYPFTYRHRPKLISLQNKEVAEVTELSEGGLRCKSEDRWPLGCVVNARIHFSDDNEEYQIVGVVVRYQGQEIVLRTPRGVSWQRMLAEQRKLLKIYPMLHQSSGRKPVLLKPAS